MFHNKTRIGSSHNKQVTVKTVMLAVDNYEGATYKILAAGYDASHISYDQLHHSASRLATLKALADEGKLTVQASERNMICEIAQEVGEIVLTEQQVNRAS